MSRTLGRLAALALILATAGALVVVWARVVQTLTEKTEPRPPIGQPRAIVWNERVFTTDRQLKGYLEAKGLSYARWVSRHPSAFAVLQHKLPASAAAAKVSRRAPAQRQAARQPALPPAKTNRSAEPVPPPSTAASAAPTAASRALANAPSARSSGTLAGILLVAGVIAIEVVLLVLAAFPAHRGPEIVRRFYLVPERRFGVIAAALAILVGVLMSVSMQ